MTERVSPEQVEALAAAAGLPLPAGRAQELAGAVSALLDDCRRLEDADVSGHEAPVVAPA